MSRLFELNSQSGASVKQNDLKQKKNLSEGKLYSSKQSKLICLCRDFIINDYILNITIIINYMFKGNYTFNYKK